MARNKFDIDETLNQEDEFNISHLLRLKKYIKPYAKELIGTIVIMLTGVAVGLIGPYLMKIELDTAIPNKDLGLVFALSAAMLGTLVLNFFFVRYRIKSMTKVGNAVVRDLRADLFKHLQELPFNYYDSRPHGKILVRVVNYVNSLSDLMSNGIVNLVTELFSLVVILIVMLIMDPKLTLAGMSGIPFLILVTVIIKNKQRDAWRVNSAKNSNLNAYIHESIAGMKVTQSFVREEENAGIFRRVTKEVRKTYMKALRIMFLMWPAADTISQAATAFIYICGVMIFTDSAGKYTIGFLIAFTGYASRFWAPINNLANIYNSIVVNTTYLERIFETIDEPVEVKDVENAETMPPVQGSIEFKDVTFSYEYGRPILRNVSFKAAKGETIALVGPTGAGKTTVVSLISRFYDVDSGEIDVDGVNIHGVTLKSLRSQMGIMLQDSFIFSGTILDNIRYGRLDATDSEIIEAAKTVCAHEFIMEMENGYETEVNERGSRLSVGQRQLISFARALLADPKILILDEATSSIDTRTEKALQQGLDRLLKGRTSFIIAHRLSTIKNADKIMYVDGGGIKESGNHDELMAEKGAYYDLYTAQYAFLNITA